MEGTLTGRTLSHYELLELLGMGGAAEVYRALDLGTEREVALKVLSERADPPMVLRFTREAKALARLDHPAIVKVYDAGLAEGQRYLAMEFMAGGSLKERLQNGPLEWQEAVKVAIEVCQALSHAHQNGIIHRDLKPANIMFDDDGHAKLADFGLAHLSEASAMTRTGTVMGTVYYLSPEQALGKQVDRRADLYSLGAVLYEMLAGEPPFTGPSAVSIIYKHLNQQPKPIRQLNDHVPVPLEGIIARLLQKDPEKRFASAQDTIAALQATIGQMPEAALAELERPEMRAQDAQAHLLPLIGREREMAALSEALAAILGGTGRTILLSGEAGTGKTRLAQDVCRLAREQNALALFGDCLYSDAPNPYAVFVELITSFRNQWLSIPEGDDSPPQAEVEALLKDVERVLRMEVSTTAEAPPWMQQLSLLEGQAQAFELVSQFFALVSRLRPLVLVLDDLQWGSVSTLYLFHYLARASRGARVLLLGIYRPEELLPGMAGNLHPLKETLQRMGREKLYQEIALGAMSAEEIASMAAKALSVPALDPDLADLLYRESEGNPLYLLEMIALLQEQGAFTREGDHWELAYDVRDIEIPGSVYDVLMRRIERVGAEDRDLLNWGAVFGRRLDVAILSDLVGGSRLEVMKRLYGLEQRYGLVASDDNGFYFAHDKIREVLYDELAPALRRELHLAVGEAIERSVGQGAETRAYDLARHFGRAGDRERGLRYSLMAADQAEKALAISEASEYLGQALRFLREAEDSDGRAEREMRLRLRRGRLESLLGHLEDARQDYEIALQLSRTLGQRGVEAEILLALSNTSGREGDWENAVLLAERSLEIATAIGSLEAQADALLSAGFYAFEQGNWDRAILRLKSALIIATQHADSLQRARILGNMAIMYNARGQARKAIELYQESIKTFDSLGYPLDVVRGLSNMGFSHYSLGEYDEALKCYRQALERLGKNGDVRERALLYLHTAEAFLARGELGKAREYCTLAARRFHRLGFELGMADVDRVYAGIARKEGRRRVAERYLRGALAVYEEHGDQLNTAETLAELGTLLQESGDSAEEELSRSRLILEKLLEDSPSDLVLPDVGVA